MINGYYLKSFLALGLCLLMSGCAFLGSRSEIEIAAQESLVSPEQEYHFGRAVAAHILQRFPIFGSTDNWDYLNSVGMYLTNYSKRPTTYSGYKFMIVDSDKPVAFSAPGGFAFISTALVDLIDSEDELAAVLAHEIGHVAEQHGVEALLAHFKLGKSKGNNVPLSCNQAFALTSFIFQEAVTSYLGVLFENGFNTDQELEADAAAYDNLQAAGYNSDALIGLLQKMRSVETNEKEVSWKKTHPDIEKRINVLKKKTPGVLSDKDAAKRDQRFNEWKSKLLANVQEKLKI